MVCRARGVREHLSWSESGSTQPPTGRLVVLKKIKNHVLEPHPGNPASTAPSAPTSFILYTYIMHIPGVGGGDPLYSFFFHLFIYILHIPGVGVDEGEGE